MVELAAAVAQTLDGADRLNVLQAMVDYTVGLQNLGADPQAATRSIASVRVKANDWFALWGVDPTTTDGVAWKLAAPHTIGSGQYEMLLNVPSVLPEMATVLLAVDKYWVESLDPGGMFKPFRTQMTASIKGKSHTFAYADGVFTDTYLGTLERKVLAGDVTMAFSAKLVLRQEYPENYHADDALVEDCDTHNWLPPYCTIMLKSFDVDLSPGDSTQRTATYSTQTNKIAGVNSRTGAFNKLTSKGNKGRIGGIKIKVTDVAP
jgi:hypothetical protein